MRVDASADRTRCHNVFLMVHLVDINGIPSTNFLGFRVLSHSTQYDGIKSIIAETMPWSDFFPRVTSLVTDGESVNSGALTGFWRKF